MGSAETDIATLPAGTGDGLKGLVRAGATIDAAMQIIDADENIVWANGGQRRLMPVVDYDAGATYESLFHALLAKGLVGNPLARARPAEFLASVRWHRAESPLAISVNRYPWGDMVVSTRRIDENTCLLLRYSTDAATLGELPEHALIAAEQARRHAQALRAGLDQISLGIALVDEVGRESYRNAALRALADRELGVRRVDGILQPVHAIDRAGWAMALAAGGGRAQTMLLRDTDGYPCIGVTISPGAHPGARLVLAGPLRPSADMLTRKTLAASLDLTPAEARIVAALGAGYSIAEIAEDKGRSRSTVHNLLASAKRALSDIGIAGVHAGSIAAIASQIAAITPRPGWAPKQGDDDAGS
jgi:DNA-binding CsgD family transcriptional regulator